MREHPDRETLKQFVSGKLASEEARQTDRHLATCSECRDRADEISEWLAIQLLDSWLRPNYDEAFGRAAESTAEKLSLLWEESRSTEALFAELLRTPKTERRREIATNERFQSLKLCQLFRSYSRGKWFSNPASALEMADLAVEIALHLDRGKYGSTLVEDSCALSWAYLGNAYRINSDLWRAERALRQAWLHHINAEQDAYTETEILIFTASLRRIQGKYDVALKLSDRAISLYSEGQDHHLEGAALILKGQILGRYGHTQESILVTQAGLERIKPAEDPRLLIAGKHNLIWSLSHGGASGEAWELLQKSRTLYRDLGPVDWVRLRWLEGEIARDLGQLAKAKSALSEVREFFLENQIAGEVALVSLDLAEVHARTGHFGLVREALDEVIPLAEALGLCEEVFLARLLYEQASRA